MTKYNLFFILAVLLSVSGCSNAIEKLKRVGKDPELANIELPTVEEDAEEQERRLARQQLEHVHMQRTNSLWQPGSTKFFRDSRAWRVGDIIRVVVEIQDNASLDNSTQQKRNGQESMGFPVLFGKEKAIASTISAKADPKSLISTNSARTQSGSGNISRKEVIKTEVAATVIKILPSGNLVISGHQEVRVNSELREIKVAGIIRPKDITTDNSVKTNQIAEARISYGGRGVVSDVQQPRVGAQIVDIISPF